MLLLPELAPSYSGKMYVGGDPGCSANVMMPPDWGLPPELELEPPLQAASRRAATPTAAASI
jgi:hypothetical protein